MQRDQPLANERATHVDGQELTSATVWSGAGCHVCAEPRQIHANAQVGLQAALSLTLGTSMGMAMDAQVRYYDDHQDMPVKWEVSEVPVCKPHGSG
jgi:hypothetical protein